MAKRKTVHQDKSSPKNQFDPAKGVLIGLFMIWLLIAGLTTYVYVIAKWSKPLPSLISVPTSLIPIIDYIRKL